MDLLGFNLPGLAAQFSHYCALVVCVYFFLVYTGSPILERLSRVGNLSLPELRRAFKSRRYKNLPIVPLMPYAQMVNSYRDRIDFERKNYAFLAIMSCCIWFLSAVCSHSIVSWISRSMFIDPMAGFGVVGKLIVLIYIIVSRKLNTATTLLSCAFAFSYSPVRIALACALTAMYGLPVVTASRFSSAFFAPYRAWKTQITYSDGTTREVYFIGPPDPFHDGYGILGTVQTSNNPRSVPRQTGLYLGVNVPDDERLAFLRTHKIAGHYASFKPEDYHTPGMLPQLYCTMQDENTDTFPSNGRYIHRSLIRCDQNHLQEMFGVPVTAQGVVLHGQAAAAQQFTAVYDGLRIRFHDFCAVPMGDNATWTLVMIGHGKCPDFLGSVRASEVPGDTPDQRSRGVCYEGPVFESYPERNVQNMDANTAPLHHGEAEFQYDLTEAGDYQNCLALGTMLSIMISLDIYEYVCSLFAGAAVSTRLATFFKPAELHPIEIEGRRLTCSNCKGPHLSPFCSKRRTFWRYLGGFSNSLILLFTSLIACLCTAKGWNNLKNVYRGLRYGIEHVIIYSPDVTTIYDYRPVTPLSSAFPDKCRLLNCLCEMVSPEEKYSAKQGMMTPACFNNVVTFLNLNPVFIMDEMTDLRDMIDAGAKFDAGKATQLGLTPVIAHAGEAYGEVTVRILDNAGFKLRCDMPGGGVAQVSYNYRTRTPAAAPMRTPTNSGLMTCPTDPQLGFDSLVFMGWSAALTLSIPIGLWYFAKKLLDANIPGEPCTVCGAVERDHFDGQCVRYSDCPKCGKKDHHPGNCPLLDKASGIVPEAAHGVCRFTRERCRNEDCPYKHRDFSVVSERSLAKAVYTGARIVCLHHDENTPCIRDAPRVLTSRCDCECVHVSLDGKGRPGNSVSVPPANVYYTPIDVFSPMLTLLNLRAPVQAEGRNDKQNSRYAGSGRHLAHSEDKRSNNRAFKGSINRDNSRIHGSDPDDFFDFVDEDHSPTDWIDYLGSRRDEFNLRSGEWEQFEDDIYTMGPGSAQRYAVDFINSHSRSGSRFRDAIDTYNSLMPEAKREKSTEPCHAFVNGDCRFGQDCRFRHVKLEDIPIAQRNCPHGSQAACRFSNCRYFAHLRSSSLTDTTPRSILKPESSDLPTGTTAPKVHFMTKKNEPVTIAAEAAVRSNPLIPAHRACPVEVAHADKTGTITLFAWKTSENVGRMTFLAPYHLFGETCPKKGTETTVFFTTLESAKAFIELTVRLEAITSPEVVYGSNDWKTAMCVFSVYEFPSARFPGLRSLSLAANTPTAPVAVTLHPAIPGHVATGTARLDPTGRILIHNISMPEQVNGEPLLRCGRALITANGVLGFHVAGEPLADVNYAFPVTRVVALLSGITDISSTPLNYPALDAQGTRSEYIQRLLRCPITRVPPRESEHLAPLDVLNVRSGHCKIVGTCKPQPIRDHGYIVDLDFFFFMVDCAVRGRHDWLVKGYVSYVLSNIPLFPPEVITWARNMNGLTPEALYSSSGCFTHVPALQPSAEVWTKNILKFFRLRTISPDYCIMHFRVLIAPFFLACNRKRPYTYMTFDEAVEDMESRGNEYRSAGAGITKNEAFRDPEFRQYCTEPFYGGASCTYVFAPKIEMRTRGKDMRSFCIQDPVSYVREIRWLRWFVDQLIEESLTGAAGAPFFNTFSPFGGPKTMVDRVASELECRPSDLWYWCYDASKSECNDFAYLLTELGRLAVEFGAPVQDVADSLQSKVNAQYIDLVTGNMYGPDADSTLPNSSGAFDTTALTSLHWATIGRAASQSMTPDLETRVPCRSTVKNAGDDGVLWTTYDPRPYIHIFHAVVTAFGGKVEFEAAPHRLSDLEPGTFNFCSVTFDTLNTPYMIRGKKTSSLVFKQAKLAPAHRMQAIDSYWLTSYYDQPMRDVLDDYRWFYGVSTLTAPHIFSDREVERIYCVTRDDNAWLETVSMRSECNGYPCPEVEDERPARAAIALVGDERLVDFFSPAMFESLCMVAQGTYLCTKCDTVVCPWCLVKRCDCRSEPDCVADDKITAREFGCECLCDERLPRTVSGSFLLDVRNILANVVRLSTDLLNYRIPFRDDPTHMSRVVKAMELLSALSPSDLHPDDIRGKDFINVAPMTMRNRITLVFEFYCNTPPSVPLSLRTTDTTMDRIRENRFLYLRMADNFPIILSSSVYWAKCVYTFDEFVNNYGDVFPLVPQGNRLGRNASGREDRSIHSENDPQHVSQRQQDDDHHHGDEAGPAEEAGTSELLRSFWRSGLEEAAAATPEEEEPSGLRCQRSDTPPEQGSAFAASGLLVQSKSYNNTREDWRWSRRQCAQDGEAGRLPGRNGDVRPGVDPSSNSSLGEQRSSPRTCGGDDDLNQPQEQRAVRGLPESDDVLSEDSECRVLCELVQCGRPAGNQSSSRGPLLAEHLSGNGGTWSFGLLPQAGLGPSRRSSDSVRHCDPPRTSSGAVFSNYQHVLQRSVLPDHGRSGPVHAGDSARSDQVLLHDRRRCDDGDECRSSLVDHASDCVDFVCPEDPRGDFTDHDSDSDAVDDRSIGSAELDLRGHGRRPERGHDELPLHSSLQQHEIHQRSLSAGEQVCSDIVCTVQRPRGSVQCDQQHEPNDNDERDPPHDGGVVAESSPADHRQSEPGQPGLGVVQCRDESLWHARQRASGDLRRRFHRSRDTAGRGDVVQLRASAGRRDGLPEQQHERSELRALHDIVHVLPQRAEHGHDVSSVPAPGSRFFRILPAIGHWLYDPLSLLRRDVPHAAATDRDLSDVGDGALVQGFPGRAVEAHERRCPVNGGSGRSSPATDCESRRE